jgi:chromosome segregation ATPase
MYAKLHQNFSNLTLRYGLLVTEKKSSDQELASVQLREKEYFGKYVSIKKDCEAQTRTFAGLNEKVAQHETTLEQNVKIVADLRKDRDEQIRKVGNLTEKVLQVKNDNEILLLKGEGHQKELQQWSDSLQEKEEDLARCISILEEERGEHADQLKQKEAEAQQQLFHMQAKLHDAEKAVKDKIADVKNKNITIEELRERLQASQDHNSRNNEIIERLNIPTLADADRLNKKLEEQQATIKKLQEMEPTVRGLQQESLSLTTANRTMKSDLAAAEWREKDLRSNKEALEKRLKAAILSLEAMKEGLADMDVKRAQLAAELDTANKTKGEIDVVCSARAVELDQAEEKISRREAKFQLQKPEELEETAQKLNEERKISKALAAENTQLAFQVASHKGTFEAERKGLWAQIKEQKQEIERLDQDVFRLASKLTAAAAKENSNPFADPSPRNVAALKLKVEQPDNFIFRNGAFDYDVVPNPDSPVTAENVKRDYVARLEDQLRIYRVLLENGNKMKKPPGIREKLFATGLYARSPHKTYVTPEYFRDVQKLKVEDDEEDVHAYDTSALSKYAALEPSIPQNEVEAEIEMIMDDEILF